MSEIPGPVLEGSAAAQVANQRVAAAERGERRMSKREGASGHMLVVAVTIVVAVTLILDLDSSISVS